MASIPTITITQDEYCTLRSHHLEDGGEGIICPGSDKSLYKFFADQKGKKISMPQNKVAKIRWLYDNDVKFITQALSIISCAGTIIGYEMTYDEEDQSLKNLDLSLEESIIILKQAKDALIYFQSLGITYGDVTSDNILVNSATKQVKFCDIDNMQVRKFKVDAKGSPLMRYYEQTGIIDAKADAYMHNLLVLKSLYYKGEYESEIIKELRRGNFCGNIPPEAKRIFESMTKPTTFNGKYAIDSIYKKTILKQKGRF